VERTPHAGERLVVIKRILPAYKNDPDYVEFFVHEARVALQLVHPNIVQAYEFGRTGDVHYLAMEYVRGCTALELLRRAAQLGKHLSLDAVCKVAADVAAGLDHVHRACDTQGNPLRIVHRDVSPHNIVIAREGLAKLVDFGIARATTQEFRTRTGVIKGKFAYLAPEQLRRGATFDHRADLWALGVVLYEMLTRRPLFRGASDADTVRRILAGRIPPLRELRPDCPAPLAAVVHKALERDVAQRYQSGADLLDELEEAARSSGLFPTMNRLRAEVEALFDDVVPTAIWTPPAGNEAPAPAAPPRPLPRATPAEPMAERARPASAPSPKPPRAPSPAPGAVPVPPFVSPISGLTPAPIAASAAPLTEAIIPPSGPTPITATDGVAAQRQTSQPSGDLPEPLPVQPRLSSPSFGQVFAEPIPDQQLEYFLRLQSARRARADTEGVPALQEVERVDDASTLFEDSMIEPESEVHREPDRELLALLDAVEPRSEPVPLRPGSDRDERALPVLPLPPPSDRTPMPETVRPLLGRAAARPSTAAAAPRAATRPPALRDISTGYTPLPLIEAQARRRRQRWLWAAILVLALASAAAAALTLVR
jgi:serine/threonine protein kinase